MPLVLSNVPALWPYRGIVFLCRPVFLDTAMPWSVATDVVPYFSLGMSMAVFNEGEIYVAVWMNSITGMMAAVTLCYSKN